jgi:prevent-host-death family protein
MDTTLTELRNHAKAFFDAVERGETVRVFRNGKAVAQIIPIRDPVAAW